MHSKHQMKKKLKEQNLKFPIKLTQPKPKDIFIYKIVYCLSIELATFVAGFYVF